MSDQLALVEIEKERQLGWVNFHPEDYCHRCGRANLSSWYVDSIEWNLAVGDDTHLILCPQCFVAAWNLATGISGTWELRLDPLTDKRIGDTE